MFLDKAPFMFMQTLYIYNVCINMKGALSRNIELTYELIYAFYNSAQNVWHIHTFLKLSCFRLW